MTTTILAVFIFNTRSIVLSSKTKQTSSFLIILLVKCAVFAVNHTCFDILYLIQLISMTEVSKYFLAHCTLVRN